MDNALYVNLTRQSGLYSELSVIASNIANMNTDGFRREATVFSEYVKAVESPAGSLSMTRANTRYADSKQGALTQTAGELDFAIEGDGYFLVNTPGGERLTRAGAFTVNADNELVTHEGFTVLSAGGAPIFIPPDAETIAVAPDGSISANDQLVDQFAVVTVNDPSALRRAGGTLLISIDGYAPTENAKVSQGFLEASNVNAVAEISRLIEVQRAYEMGQSLNESENERLQKAIQTLGRAI